MNLYIVSLDGQEIGSVHAGTEAQALALASEGYSARATVQAFALPDTAKVRRAPRYQRAYGVR